MRLSILLAACALLPATAQDRFTEFEKRRVALEEALPGGLTVLFGASEKDSLRTGFFQEPNFYYLSGWTEPDALLLIAPAVEEKKLRSRHILFLPSRAPENEKWTGRKTDPGEASAKGRSGFREVLPAERFEEELRGLLAQYPRLYTLKGQPAAEKLNALAPLRDIADAGPAIAKLRMTKSEHEIALIQRSTDVTVLAHRAAWKRAAPGLYEYQIAATMSAVYFEKGCERHAYSPIVGSGPNSVILHYTRNARRMDLGEVLLMDVAAECSYYSSDITRTIPVGGKFSKRQREIYDIVSGAQKAVVAAVKPGTTLSKTGSNSLYKIAYDYIDSHGKDKHGQSLGKYFNHGIGHHVGLGVHDAYDPEVPLGPGMVITVEPGIYIPEENIGVRLEDVVLVTDNGARVLSAALPLEPGEVERELQGAKAN